MEDKHFDFVGNEVKPGDIVVCLKAGSSSSWMVYGVVVSFTRLSANVLMSGEYGESRTSIIAAYENFLYMGELPAAPGKFLQFNDNFYRVARRDKRGIVKFIDNFDGYHTMSELYDHRAALFAVTVNEHKSISWKSKQHHDGTMYDGMFIVGMDTPYGQVSYHYNTDKCWDMFKCKELERAPEWDGHTPADVVRRLTEFSKYGEKGNFCPTCHGTGYRKSYCDEPDSRCTDCEGTGKRTEA